MLENKDPLAHATVWLLSDGRPGHENQSRGVLQALGIKDYKIHTLKLKKYGRILSFLGPQATFQSLPPEPYPDVIIGCGSHVSSVAAYIKRRSPTTFLIQLMNTPKNPHLFNVIAAPSHDNPPKTLPQLITTLGAPNAINAASLKTEADRWQSRLQALPKPYTAVLIGGSSKRFQFTPRHAQKLAQNLTKFAQQHHTSLLISTSRRTGKAATQIIEKELKKTNIPHYFWDSTQTSNRDNPYHAFLGLADNIIVTADSVSMLSEAASTGKNTLIWGREFMRAGKFNHFYNALISNQSLQDFNTFNTHQKPQPLNEATRIAGFIRSQYTRWLQTKIQ